jgi:hypothetical protein
MALLVEEYMTTDIPVQASFRGHRKRKKPPMLLGLKPSATDYLVDLSMNTSEHHRNGILSGMDKEEGTG